MVKTSLGLEENFEAVLCYFGIWVTGLIFYFVEDKNKFIRFHAMQSILVFLPLTILAWLFGGFFGIFRLWFLHGLFLLWISWLFWILRSYPVDYSYDESVSRCRNINFRLLEILLKKTHNYLSYFSFFLIFH